jgi:methionyl-tRNA formyltransferase
MICIAGKNEIAVYGLRLALETLGLDNVVVCANRSDDGQSNWQPSLIRYAREFGVPVLSLSDLYKIPDLLFLSLEFDRIIQPKKFASSELYNIHFSRLPAYKGVYTSAWPILNGENQSGVTLHKIDSGIDTGDIITQIEFDLSPQETARSLYFKYMAAASSLLDESMSLLIAGNPKSSPQSAAGSTYYGKSSIDYGNPEIRFDCTASQVSQQIRAFSFREFQVPTAYGLSVSECIILESRSKQKAGKIISSDADGVRVATIDFDVHLNRDRSLDLLNMFERGSHISRKQIEDHAEFLNLKSRQGWSALMIAAYRGDTEACRYLLDSGANPELTNCNGTTPLMYAKEYAARTGDLTTAKLLIENGATITQVDSFGRTVIDYCLLNDQSDLADRISLLSEGVS